MEVPVVDRVEGGGGCMVVGDDSRSASCREAGLDNENCCVELDSNAALPALVSKPKVDFWEWVKFEGKQDLRQLRRRPPRRNSSGGHRAERTGALRPRGRWSKQ